MRCIRFRSTIGNDLDSTEGTAAEIAQNSQA